MKRTKDFSENRGITLIALVITIIVMLILVAVTISMAVNGGLFNYAGKAVGDTNNAMQKEQQLGSGGVTIDGIYYNSIDEYLKTTRENEGEGEKVELPTELKVGDYVNYTPTPGTYKVADGANGSGYTTIDGYQTFTTETGENALKWRVLSINEENGTVELVSETEAQVIYLQGEDGYNHAVDILNDLCKTLYSNENGAEARSIKVEDINAKTTYDYTTYNCGTFTYGDTKQLSTYGTNYMKYPNLYSQEIGYGSANTFNTSGLSVSEGLNDGVTDANEITTYGTVIGIIDGNIAGTDPYITYTAYEYRIEDFLNTTLGVNVAPEGLLDAGMTYWVASRSVGERGEPMYGICYVGQAPGGGRITTYPLISGDYYSTGVR